MKDIAAFISYLHTLDVKLWVEGGQLRFRVPKAHTALLPALRTELAERKAAILTFLDTQRRASPQLPPIDPVSRDRDLPLSFGQQRLWFLDQWEGASATYNVATALHLQGSLERAALERAIGEIVQRHESLRSYFPTVDGIPVVHFSTDAFTLPISHQDHLSPREQTREIQRCVNEEAERPFDLAKGPLFRSRLIQLGSDSQVLLVTLHHSIADAWSIGVFVRELSTLYQAYSQGRPSPLPPLSIQYADYAHWQHQWLRGEALQNQLDYWRRQLAGAPALLELPTDRPRPPVQRFCGAAESVQIGAALVERLKALSQRAGATLFMTLLAGFATLLWRYSGMDDIVVGTPVANRRHWQTEPLIGFFVNTLALRIDLKDTPRFEELLQQIQRVAVDAYAHQDLPFERLVEELNPDRNLSHTPLFQVMFVLQNVPLGALELGGLTITPIAPEHVIAKFDLSLELSESAQGIEGWLEYNTDLFDRATIRRMVGHWQTLLEGIAADSGQSIAALPLLTDAERQQLAAWNDTAAAYPQGRCIHQLFETQVEKTPEATAVSFEEQRLSYAELNARANQLAHYLYGLGVRPEERVGICLERSLEMVVGLMGVLKAGGAYLPLDPAYPAARLAFMLEDARPSVLITTMELLERWSAPPQAGMEMGYRIVCLDTLETTLAALAGSNPVSGVAPANPAYVIYTSGSTGRPKGTVVSHQALCNHTAWMQSAFPLHAHDRVLQKTPFSFDASVWEFFSPLSAGAQLVMARPEGHQDSRYLIQAIAGHRITTLQLVPSLLQALLSEEGVETLRSLRRIFCGGEVLPVALVADCLARLEVQLINLYGPTEACIDVTYWPCRSTAATAGATPTEYDDSPGKPPIGRPIANTRIHILDRWQKPVPIGVPGELHSGGVGLARGYLNRPGLTAEKFIPDPCSAEVGARLYRTGDWARYRPDGSIEYLGRIDQQVKLRGFRIEPGEIEAALAHYPGVRGNAVITREQQLVAYLVADRQQGIDSSALRRFLQERLPDYMIPSVFVTLEALPLTPSGKIDRRALQDTAVRLPPPGQTFEPPRTPAEELLAGIWAEVLGLERVGLSDNFFELGGHSLLATQVMSRLRDTFAVELPLRRLFEAPTVAALSARIQAARQEQQELPAPPLTRVAGKGDIPLSFAQERLWFLALLTPDNPFYNTPVALRLSGPLDSAALAESWREIVRRHEILRTTFHTLDGQPVQRIHPFPATHHPLTVIDLPDVAAVQRLAAGEAQRPFDLEQGPLCRALLVRLAPADQVLLVTLHHIVTDGWSAGIFVRELSALYQAFATGQESPLPELPIQYADFALWQRRWLSGPVLAAQLDYWQRQLTSAPHVLDLPGDHPRPPVHTFHGGIEHFAVTPELTQQLKRLSRQSGVTLFMTLLAAFALLLSRYSGQQELLIGAPIANRNRREIEPLIGFFVNTLVLHIDLAGQPSFVELLERVRQITLEAYAHQDLPFEQLVEALQPARDMTRNPLVQVALVFQNAALPPLILNEVAVAPLDVDSSTVRFDLEFHLWEAEDRLVGHIFYYRDVFEGATIARLLTHFNTLLAAVAAAPERPIGHYPLLDPVQQHRLLVEWNHTATDFPYCCLQQLFEAQVEKTPQATALVFEKQRLSYAELNARANRLAHYLQAQGVRPDVLVGVYVERSPEMVIALLGILKAGGAYLPLDPAYPLGRLAFMLEDAGVRLLLTQASLASAIPAPESKIVCLDTAGELFSRYPAMNPTGVTDPAHLAYVIYTSGSTGQPKGVMITHRALVNFLTSLCRQPGLEAQDIVLALTTIAFDIATLELYGPLLVGAQVVIVPREMAQDGWQLGEHIARTGVTVMQATPATWRLLLTANQASRLPGKILCGGEALLPELSRLLLQKGGAVWNLYGPTETTVWSAAYHLTDNASDARPEPLGYPIANTRIHILDPQLNPVPPGVPGELTIGGVGLARGYLKRPGLTAARFIPDPCGAEPGARLYRTGDRARYRPDGTLEYLGRLDHQVKLRGFRIELGEIEAALGRHPAVREAVVMAHGNAGDQRLQAYVVPDPAGQRADGEAIQVERLTRWQQIWNDTYRQPAGDADPTFNVSGWNDSYTGQPLAREAMQEWVDATVEQILARRPQRVLEIGCGTGLLLFRIAPCCRRYVGTDISAEALRYIEGQLPGSRLPVTLQQRAADDFTGIEPEAFDAVILNSVVQYFPSIDYLLAVLAGAITAVAPGGFVFIGDVRSLPLLEAFHAAVQLQQAPATLPTGDLHRLIQKHRNAEAELVIDPDFFLAIKPSFPRLGRVQIELKRGRCHTEVTKFRYDVTLHLGDDAAPVGEFRWRDWPQERWTLAALRRYLLDEQPGRVDFKGIPNARLAAETRLLERLADPQDNATAGELRQLIDQGDPGVEPEDLRALSRELSYTAYLSESPEQPGCFAAVLQRGLPEHGLQPFTTRDHQLKPWHHYANNPLHGEWMRRLTAQWPAFLRASLPEYMIPAAFVVVDALPLTPNGKVDRRTLVQWSGSSQPPARAPFVAPRTPGEERLAGIWKAVLATEQVGIHDNFFELGGHSLLATQVVSRIREAFAIELPLRYLFESPTVVSLAERIEVLCWASAGLQNTGDGTPSAQQEKGTL
jgi:amino acid adenylation domain-containing protein